MLVANVLAAGPAGFLVPVPLIVLEAARASLQSSGLVRLASMASWIGHDIDLKQVLILGFITSPLEFSQSERQPRGLTRPVADASLQSPTQLHNEIDHHDVAVSPVVTNQAANEETGETSPHSSIGKSV